MSDDLWVFVRAHEFFEQGAVVVRLSRIDCINTRDAAGKVVACSYCNYLPTLSLQLSNQLRTQPALITKHQPARWKRRWSPSTKKSQWRSQFPGGDVKPVCNILFLN